MPDAVTPPNPADPGASAHHQGPRGKSGDDTRSSPDPTLMTIDALRREIAMLNDLLESQIEANEVLTVERFHRVDQDLKAAENQRREQKQDTKEAVDAALASQKESTAKMESSVTNQITSLKNNVDTSFRSTESAISDLKDRLTILESVRQGQSMQRDERRQSSTAQIAAIGVGISLLLALLTIAGFLAGGQA